MRNPASEAFFDIENSENSSFCDSALSVTDSLYLRISNNLGQLRLITR